MILYTLPHSSYATKVAIVVAIKEALLQIFGDYLGFADRQITINEGGNLAHRNDARSRFFSRFHDIHLEPPIRNIYYQVPESTRDMSVVDENLARIQVLLDRFGSIAQPAPFLIGDRIRLADCAYPSTLMYLELVTEAMGRAVSYPANIAAWHETVLAHPDVSRVMARNRAAAEAWLPKKLAE